MSNLSAETNLSILSQGIDYNTPAITLSRSLNSKVKHILLEAQEVAQELDEMSQIIEENLIPMTKEIIDTMVTCQTTLNHLNVMGVPVQQMINEVIEKNRVRGYYDVGGIEYTRQS